MVKNHSKTGLSLAVIYVLSSLWVFYYAYNCGSGLCALAALIPLSPWPQLFEGFMDLGLPRAFMAVFFLVNTALVYYLGKKLAELWKKIFSN